jgi:hypothetical protein
MFTLLCTLPATAARAQLYGLSGPGSGTGQLYTIDTTTGVATLAANLSGPPSTFPALGGLDFYTNALYATGVFVGAGNPYFGTINTSTGVFTPIVQQDQSNWQGLASNTSAGVFYTVGENNLPYVLKSVTPLGIVTDIGPTAAFGGGLAYDNVNGILYASGDNGGGNAALFTINTSTGAATAIGNMGLPSNPVGLAYDPSANALYLNDGTTNNLYRVSTSTGAATLIGSNGVSAAIGSLGFIPEPASVTCIGLVALILATRRRTSRA